MSFLKLLTPWGLLGLLGILILILIYILKPNYQQKIVSSTYIWKLSLKYRKKRIPINRFRNILIFICQLLIISCCAFLLAQPFIAAQKMEEKAEKVIIIDASASMLVANDIGETRFERAIMQVKESVKNTIDQDSNISIILADDSADFIVQRAGADDLEEVNAALDALIGSGELQCSYGSADMEGAVSLAEQFLLDSPKTEVLLYTATEYIEKGDITVVNVAEEGEWNAAVMGVTATLNDENYYEFNADVACYGRSEELVVHCDIYGANGADSERDYPTYLTEKVMFSFAEPRVTVKFNVGEIYSYDYVHVYVEAEDTFDDDNTFYLYGGKRPTLKVLYSSSLPNNYFSGFFLSLRESMADLWNIELKEVTVQRESDFITSGYDFYIYEHAMPKDLPTDGVVFLADPDLAPNGADFTFAGSESVDSQTSLASGNNHAITSGMNASTITISKYGRITSQDGYTELMYFAGDPILMVKENELKKIVVLSLDLNYSNLAMLPDFLFLLYNTFNYFLPATFSGNSFEIGDTVTLNARAPFLNLSAPDLEVTYDSFPASLVVTKPGTYTLTQDTLLGEKVKESFYVHVPNIESDISKTVDALPLLIIPEESENDDFDLLFYLSIALVALLFVEWWLQSREYF